VVLLPLSQSPHNNTVAQSAVICLSNACSQIKNGIDTLGGLV
jgi:hypothetical protein